MIPAVRNQIYNLGTAKTLGVIVCSLDLNSDTYSGNWAANKTYAIGDVVEFTPDNSSPDFYKCKVAHTSSNNLNPTDTTKWESATKSGYIVLSNGLKIQWGKKDGYTRHINFNIHFETSCVYLNFIANRSSSTENGWHYYYNLTNSDVYIMQNDETALWIAIGY